MMRLIAGEITLSEQPGAAIKRWREMFRISQRELAQRLEVGPSVISDYESGRRKSPGTAMIRRIVEALISIDQERGSPFLSKFGPLLTGEIQSKAILSMKDFFDSINAIDLFDILEARVVACEELLDRELYGYTVVDSINAILSFSPLELARLYGSTTQRALIFTKVTTGRSPMIAIRVTTLKPSVVIMHGPRRTDPIAKKLAELERIPMGISRLKTPEEIVERLKDIK